MVKSVTESLDRGIENLSLSTFWNLGSLLDLASFLLLRLHWDHVCGSTFWIMYRRFIDACRVSARRPTLFCFGKSGQNHVGRGLALRVPCAVRRPRRCANSLRSNNAHLFSGVGCTARPGHKAREYTSCVVLAKLLPHPLVLLKRLLADSWGGRQRQSGPTRGVYPESCRRTQTSPAGYKDRPPRGPNCRRRTFEN